MSPRKPNPQRERILAGQCPACGKDAAPYRLCVDHRAQASISSMLNKWAKRGAVTKSKIGGASHWTATPEISAIVDTIGHRKMPLWDGDGSDRRLQPKLRGLRVDVEQTLISLLRDMGRPATIEEIQAAWGRLRGERKHGSLAADVKQIVQAKRRREERALRRAKSFQQPCSTPP